MIYIMSDIHGLFRPFIRMLKHINFHDSDTLYILGDVIDRGTGGVAMLNYCKSKENIHLLKGNHEDMMQRAIEGERYGDVKLWYDNGGDITDHTLMRQGKEVEEELLAYIKSLPLYFDITVKEQPYLLIHAGLSTPFEGLKLNPKDFAPLTKENILDYNIEEEIIFWNRKQDATQRTRNTYFPEYKIIHGHTPHDGKCFFNNECMNIDTGCAGNRELSCYCVNANKMYVLDIKADEFDEYIVEGD